MPIVTGNSQATRKSLQELLLERNQAMGLLHHKSEGSCGLKQAWRVRSAVVLRAVCLKPAAQVFQLRCRQLYGGDSYVVLYTYQVNKREHYIVYYWLVGGITAVC